MTKNELKAKQQCNEWLAECLELGWRERDLYELEEIWWKFHDKEGNLK